MTNEKTEEIRKTLEKTFPQGSGLENLGKSLMDSYQNRRRVMEIRERYHTAASKEEKDKIRSEFDRYVRNLPREGYNEAYETWQERNDPWYNPGKS